MGRRTCTVSTCKCLGKRVGETEEKRREEERQGGKGRGMKGGHIKRKEKGKKG